MATAILMAKIPRPGRVKTRLCPPLSPEQAAQVHGLCLTHSLFRLLHDEGWSKVVWSFAGGSTAEAEAFLDDLDLPRRPTVREQGDGTLGDRMAEVASSVSGDSVAFFGADTPHLPMSHVEATLQACGQGRSAIGPSDDGGFWTLVVPAGLGLSDLLANVDWSSGNELSDVRRNYERAGWQLDDLPVWWDVDRPDDLARLAAAEPDWFRDLPDVVAAVAEGA